MIFKYLLVSASFASASPTTTISTTAPSTKVATTTSTTLPSSTKDWSLLDTAEKFVAEIENASVDDIKALQADGAMLKSASELLTKKITEFKTQFAAETDAKKKAEQEKEIASYEAALTKIKVASRLWLWITLGVLGTVVIVGIVYGFVRK